MSKLEELIEKLCPNGVEFKNLQYLCGTITTGKLNANAMEDNGLYPFFTCDSNPFKINTYAFDEEAILISGNGSQVGHINYYKGKFNAYQRTYVIYDFKEINVKFLLHYLNGCLKEYILRNCKKGSVPYITLPMLQKFSVPVPPLEVQCEIVHFLDDFTLLSALLSAELSAELKARQKQYEYYASKLFTSFKAKDYPMGELAKFVYGYTDKAIDNGNTRFIRITDINEQGCLKKDDIKYINMNEKAQKSLLKKGDLVMARTGATFGKTLYFDDDIPSVYASFLIKIIPDNTKLLNKYYWHFTKTQLYWSQANKLVTNGGQPQFNTPALKKIRIPIPTIDEQYKVVDILDRLDKICNDISEGLPAEIEARQKQYEYYRDKLLTFKELKVNE